MNERDNLKVQFSRCVEECMSALYQLAVRLTRNNTDAEDLVAESVTKAWVAFESLEDKNRFRSWIFRIIHNCFISNYRKKVIRPNEVSYDESESEENCEDGVVPLLLQQDDDFVLWWANPERELANKLLGEDISSAIEKLPEVFRVTIVLVNVFGLSYDDAAEVLNVPPGTVRSRMKRGRTLLQKHLWHHAKEAGLIAVNELQESPL